MATDAYLKIEGVKGESQDDGHKDWIECSSVTWSVFQPKSATASTGGGHTAERAELSDIVLHKLADLSSPILLQMCAAGKTLPKAKIEFMRADGDGKPVKYFEIELENVLIGQVSPSIGAGHIMSETIGLKYSQIKWKYTQQKVAGGAGGNTAGGWSLSSNKIV